MKGEMIIKYFITGCLAIACVMVSHAQTIKLDFPKFADKKYVYLLMQGDKKDTIAKGILDKEGKTMLTIPKEYKDYKGMSQWMLIDGGGLDMIVNQENFSVGSPEEQPYEENITYKESKENSYLIEQFVEQERLMQKSGLLRMIFQLYKPEEKAYDFIKNEMNSQEALLKQLVAETAKSPLYAARFREIADYAGGTVPKVYHSEEDKAKDYVQFAADKVNMDLLYTSGHWSSLLNGWMQMEISFVKDDSKLLSDSKKMLYRTKTVKVYTDLAEKMVALYTKHGKDLLLKELALVIKEQGRLENPSWILKRMANGQIGEMAPKIVGLEKPIELVKDQNTLLFFYQSGCGNCDKEIKALKLNYSELQKNKTRVISIAADSDEEIHKYGIASFPWEDRLWDKKMFEGDNFINYGIIGTPTYILIDGEGKISGRYAELEQTGLLK
jgi:hypothetical protein